MTSSSVNHEIIIHVCSLQWGTYLYHGDCTCERFCVVEVTLHLDDKHSIILHCSLLFMWPVSYANLLPELGINGEVEIMCNPTLALSPSFVVIFYKKTQTTIVIHEQLFNI